MKTKTLLLIKGQGVKLFKNDIFIGGISNTSQDLIKVDIEIYSETMCFVKAYNEGMLTQVWCDRYEEVDINE